MVGEVGVGKWHDSLSSNTRESSERRKARVAVCHGSLLFERNVPSVTRFHLDPLSSIHLFQDLSPIVLRHVPVAPGWIGLFLSVDERHVVRIPVQRTNDFDRRTRNQDLVISVGERRNKEKKTKMKKRLAIRGPGRLLRTLRAKNEQFAPISARYCPREEFAFKV